MESSRSQKTVSDHCLIWARPCEGSSSGAPAAAAAAAAGRWRCWSSNSCSIERVAGTVWQLCQLYQFAAVWHVAEAQGPPDCLWSRPPCIRNMHLLMQNMPLDKSTSLHGHPSDLWAVDTWRQFVTWPQKWWAAWPWSKNWIWSHFSGQSLIMIEIAQFFTWNLQQEEFSCSSCVCLHRYLLTILSRITDIQWFEPVCSHRVTF